MKKGKEEGRRREVGEEKNMGKGKDGKQQRRS